MTDDEEIVSAMDRAIAFAKKYPGDHHAAHHHLLGALLGDHLSEWHARLDALRPPEPQVHNANEEQR